MIKVSKKEKKSYSVFCDGGARGNPGPAAVGFVIYNSQEKTIVKAGKFIGKTTNNVAEYWAVIEALKWLKKHRPESGLEIQRINFFLDSNLVVNQLNGLYKIKNARLRKLAIKVRQLENEFPQQIFYQFVSRNNNKIADGLVNKVLKKKLATG